MSPRVDPGTQSLFDAAGAQRGNRASRSSSATTTAFRSGRCSRRAAAALGVAAGLRRKPGRVGPRPADLGIRALAGHDGSRSNVAKDHNRRFEPAGRRMEDMVSKRVNVIDSGPMPVFDGLFNRGRLWRAGWASRDAPSEIREESYLNSQGWAFQAMFAKVIFARPGQDRRVTGLMSLMRLMRNRPNASKDGPLQPMLMRIAFSGQSRIAGASRPVLRERRSRASRALATFASGALEAGQALGRAGLFGFGRERLARRREIQ